MSSPVRRFLPVSEVRAIGPRALGRVGLLALAAWLLGGAFAPAGACRCAQLPLETYFERAEIVVVGRARTVAERVDGRYRAVLIEPGWRPFKGSLDGVTLVTATSTAGCGVEIEHGASYVIFASRLEDQPGLAVFDTCSGSRRYPAPSDHGSEPVYQGLPDNRIVARLFELQSGGAPPANGVAAVDLEPFHTNPACWEGPRMVQTGLPPAELRQRVVFSARRAPEPELEAMPSPNGAYRLWVRNPDTTRPGPWNATLLVDVERDDLLSVDLRDIAQPVSPRWINEKLLYLRVAWGRVAFSDLIVDVEQGEILYEEVTRWAAEAFDQYRLTCGGQCPCAPEAGAVLEATEPPIPRPAPGEPTQLDFLVSSLAYLDGDWDGRVFTAPGEGSFVRSALHGARARAETDAEVLEVRRVGDGLWLRVRLFARNRCDDPRAPSVHQGWVPAYSEEGRLVAWHHPGGC